MDKFPKRYSFKLTDYGCKNLWSKYLTANISSKSRSNPRVFTEQGVYISATILKGKKASRITPDAFKIYLNSVCNRKNKIIFFIVL